VGWSCHWVLLEVTDPYEVARRLGGHLGDGRLPIGDESSRRAPGPAVGPVWGRWRFLSDAHWQLVEAPVLRRLSMGTRLLRLAVEEHVMFAEAAQWTDGVETWRITGDYDTSDPAVKSHGHVPDHLLEPPDPTSGSLVFDVPVAAIHRLTAWRYDGTNPELDEARYSPILR
jgi:hypothetical protein